MTATVTIASALAAGCCEVQTYRIEAPGLTAEQRATLRSAG